MEDTNLKELENRYPDFAKELKRAGLDLSYLDFFKNWVDDISKCLIVDEARAVDNSMIIPKEDYKDFRKLAKLGYIWTLGEPWDYMLTEKTIDIFLNN